jgi:hypothetical protein
MHSALLEAARDGCHFYDNAVAELMLICVTLRCFTLYGFLPRAVTQV